MTHGGQPNGRRRTAQDGRRTTYGGRRGAWTADGIRRTAASPAGDMRCVCGGLGRNRADPCLLRGVYLGLRRQLEPRQLSPSMRPRWAPRQLRRRRRLRQRRRRFLLPPSRLSQCLAACSQYPAEITRYLQSYVRADVPRVL